jgi:hypothetical protein
MGGTRDSPVPIGVGHKAKFKAQSFPGEQASAKLLKSGEMGFQKPVAEFNSGVNSHSKLALNKIV